MPVMLELDGIFKVSPFAWEVRKASDSKSTAISLRFRVVGQWMPDDQTWHDWSVYEETHVFGDYWVIKKDGTVNAKTVEQLAKSLGWQGSFGQVATSPPPDVVVQVEVRSEVYKGAKRYRAEWMNPEGHIPGGSDRGADEAAVRELDALFGSQVRAVAATSKPKPNGKPPPPPPPKAAPAPVAAPVSEETPWESDVSADKEADARSRQ